MDIDSRLEPIGSSLYRVAVRGIIIHSEKILLIQEQAGPDETWWGMPGGGIPYGESPRDVLRRMVAEQLDLPLRDVHCGVAITWTIFGTILNGIPRATLCYRVNVPRNDVGKGAQILARDWFTYEEVRALRISPSIGKPIDLSRLLRRLVVLGSKRKS
ncbi:MAG: NUDIX hydrolase [Candidatus Saccharibacteria bacterium]